MSRLRSAGALSGPDAAFAWAGARWGRELPPPFLPVCLAAVRRPPASSAVPARLPGGRPAASGFLRRLVAVEAVAELDAEAPERPLHAVRHRALDGGLVAVGVVLGHGVEPDVGAGRRAGDGDPHRGAVDVGELHLAGLRIDVLELAQGHVPDQLVSPSAKPEDAVGLVDDDVAFQVVVGAPGAGSRGCPRALVTAGGSPSQSSSCSLAIAASGLCPLPVPLLCPLLLPFLLTMSVSFCVVSFL